MSPTAALVLLGLAATAPAQTAAQSAPDPAVQRADPWLPPAARMRSTEPPAAGAALEAVAVDKLRRRFEAADAPRFGTLSRDQARRAGLGFVAEHFDRIDATRSGHVSFEEVRRYLASRDR